MSPSGINQTNLITSRRYGRPSVASSVASPAELPEVKDPTPYTTPKPSSESTFAPTVPPAARDAPRFISRKRRVDKPSEDKLHICPYTELYYSRERPVPFGMLGELTCDEHVTFLSRSDLLCHMSERHLTRRLENLMDQVFALANRPGGAQSPMLQKLWWNAVFDQQVIFMKYLLDKLRFDVDMMIEFGPEAPAGCQVPMPAIYWSAFHGNHVMLQLLLGYNANPRPECGAYWTPELFALARGDHSTAQLLNDAEARRKRESRKEAERIAADDLRRAKNRMPTRESVLEELQRRRASRQFPSEQAPTLKRPPTYDSSNERPSSRHKNSHFDLSGGTRPITHGLPIFTPQSAYSPSPDNLLSPSSPLSPFDFSYGPHPDGLPDFSSPIWRDSLSPSDPHPSHSAFPLSRHSRHSSIGSLAGNFNDFNIYTSDEPRPRLDGLPGPDDYSRVDGLPGPDPSYWKITEMSSASPTSSSTNRPLKAMPSQHHAQQQDGLWNAILEGPGSYVPRDINRAQPQQQQGSRPGSSRQNPVCID